MTGYDWRWEIFLPHLRALAGGVWVTIQLSFLATVVGTAAGLLGALLLRQLPWRPVRAGIFLTNDMLRAVPLFILLTVAYYAPWKDMGIAPLSEFTAAWIALALSQAVFCVDLYYWAFERVNLRTIEAAESVGLSRPTIFWHFVLPDVCRQTMPALTAFVIGLVKLSAFAAVIGCQEIVYIATTIGSGQSRSLEPWFVAAGVYIVLITPATILGRRWENSAWMRRR